MAAAEEAEQEFSQQQAADEDVQQWVSQVEEQAAAGEAEVVGAAMVEAALEVAAMAEAAAVVDAAEMAEAAEMAVVWDTAGTAARRSEIVIEEQPEQGCGGDTDGGAQEMAAETEVEAMDEDGRGASAEEIGARTRIFDPGIFNSDTFLFGVESFSC